MAHGEDASKDGVGHLLQNAIRVPRSTSHLEPEESPFSCGFGMALYQGMLAESLLGAAEHEARSLAPAWELEEKAILICVPSFEPEWALSMVGDRKSAYWVLRVQAQESLWYSTKFWYSTEGSATVPSAPTINLYRSELAADLGGAVCDIWSQVLSQTRYPPIPWQGCDGETYHITYSRRGQCRTSGKTWSPPENSVPGKIVSLGRALGDYAKDSANQDVFLRVIQDHIEWFQTHSQDEGASSLSSTA